MSKKESHLSPGNRRAVRYQRRKAHSSHVSRWVVVLGAGALVLGAIFFLPQIGLGSGGAAGYPAFVRAAGPQAVAAYGAATTYMDEMGQLVCYCGCVAAGHDSLRDCFIDDVAVSGTVTYDGHAASCSTCMTEALDASAALKSGKTLYEVRAQIDAAYGGYGPGTNTPPVAP
jgi:hypothetical protein